MFEDVRRASVLNMAAHYEVDAVHTEHVATLALGMFDALAELGLHDGDPRERELLWAACMLHDIGMSIDYDDHHKHSRYLILNGGLPGFTPVETAIIAQSARYHRKGMPAPGPMAPLFGPGTPSATRRRATLLRSPRTSSARAISSCAARTSRSTTGPSSCISWPRASRPSRAGPRAARELFERASASSGSRRRAQRRPV
jgi:exopolyphosphatase/guanosine-5'-triphosphate,3'-diphosphate pyrophosphatase